MRVTSLSAESIGIEFGTGQEILFYEVLNNVGSFQLTVVLILGDQDGISAPAITSIFQAALWRIE